MLRAHVSHSWAQFDDIIECDTCMVRMYGPTASWPCIDPADHRDHAKTYAILDIDRGRRRPFELCTCSDDVVPTRELGYTEAERLRALGELTP